MSYEQGLLAILAAFACVLFVFIFLPQVRLFLRLVKSRSVLVAPASSVGTKPLRPKDKKVMESTPLPRGKSQLRSPTFVDFDPTNLVHQAALYMMMAEQRLHPFLRFHFDSGRFDNAFDACISAMAEYAITDEAKSLAKATAALKKAQANPKATVKKVPRKRATGTALSKSSKSKTRTVNKKVGISEDTEKAAPSRRPGLKLC
jgi:hypothetical protein